MLLLVIKLCMALSVFKYCVLIRPNEMFLSNIIFVWFSGVYLMEIISQSNMGELIGLQTLNLSSLFNLTMSITTNHSNCTSCKTRVLY